MPEESQMLAGTAITFFVQGTPKPQPRVKAFSRGKHAGVYDPGTADDWKGCIDRDSREFRPELPMDCPLRVILHFKFPRPKNHFKTGKNAHIMRDDAPSWHTGARDVDNLAKAVMDVLTMRGFWKDDGQVCSLRVTKAYDEKPGCFVTIQKL